MSSRERLHLNKSGNYHEIRVPTEIELIFSRITSNCEKRLEMRHSV